MTLLQIAGMVREGEEVQIIDNNTKDDLTEVTLAQIIYEEQKAHSRSVPLQTLKELATEINSTTVFPMPIDLFEPFRAFAKAAGIGDDKPKT